MPYGLTAARNSSGVFGYALDTGGVELAGGGLLLDTGGLALEVAGGLLELDAGDLDDEGATELAGAVLILLLGSDELSAAELISGSDTSSEDTSASEDPSTSEEVAADISSTGILFLLHPITSAEKSAKARKSTKTCLFMIRHNLSK